MTSRPADEGMDYIVKRGDCLTTIAARFGFADYNAIYGHPKNRSFRELRKNPNVIHAGDKLFIPEPEAKSLPCATGSTHRFRMRRPLKKIHVVLRDHEGKPIANKPYVLVAGGETFTRRTGEDGAIEADVPAELAEAKLTVSGMTRTLKIGDLNPLRAAPDDGISGIKARLTNLGFDTGGLGATLDDDTRDAIREFQEANRLDPTGEIDELLLAKLEEKYPC